MCVFAGMKKPITQSNSGYLMCFLKSSQAPSVKLALADIQWLNLAPCNHRTAVKAAALQNSTTVGGVIQLADIEQDLSIALAQNFWRIFLY